MSTPGSLESWDQNSKREARRGLQLRCGRSVSCPAIRSSAQKRPLASRGGSCSGVGGQAERPRREAKERYTTQKGRDCIQNNSVPGQLWRGKEVQEEKSARRETIPCSPLTPLDTVETNTQKHQRKNATQTTSQFCCSSLTDRICRGTWCMPVRLTGGTAPWGITQGHIHMGASPVKGPMVFCFPRIGGLQFPICTGSNHQLKGT